MNTPFVSICIPSYNRPDTLLRLLRTIDSKASDLQIVICEDKSPKRLEIRAAVETFKKETRYEVKYIENEVNKGYDWNVRDFIIHADGEYMLYMGDDDGFIPGKLDCMIDFLREHRELGYVLRCYQTSSGETMRYFVGSQFFEPGLQSYLTLFRKTVFISGITFKREWVKDTMTDNFDGTLLYQLYMVSEVALNHPTAYLDVPVTHAFPRTAEYGFFFGTSEKEKGRYEPNKISVRGEMIFVTSFLQISRFIDEKYRLSSTRAIQNDISKYSYPLLAYVQEIGRWQMLRFAKEMIKEGMGRTIYLYIYTLGLLLLGTRNCNKIIAFIKKRLGRTPQL